MKKQVIAAAIATAVAAPAAMAGAPTVYGLINMSVDSLTIKNAAGATDNAQSGIFVSSNNSRIGVKGAQELGNGLKAIYKIEFGTAVDVAGGGGGVTGRNAYAGVAGGFGAVLLGRHDTPFKMVQPTDTFNDGYGDNNPMAGRLGFASRGGEFRSGDVLAYVSPSFGGVKFIGALVPNEGTNTDNAGNAKKSTLFDVYSLGVTYGSKKKGLYLAGAYNGFSGDAVNGVIWNNRANFGLTNAQAMAAMSAAGGATEYRLAAQYTMGSLMGNIIYQKFDISGIDAAVDGLWMDGDNWMANIAYTVGAATLKGKYSAINYDAAGLSNGDAYGLGVDYALGKKTTAYVEYVARNNVAGDRDVDNTYLSVGLLHKF